MGLAGEMTPQDTIDRLLPTVRHNFVFESDQIRDADFPHYYKISEYEARETNVAALRGFLDIVPERAQDILDIDYLYTD